MHDWTQIVRERLQGQIRVPDPGVISELATHLEEVYEEARSLGLTEQQAIQTALQKLEDCCALTAEIHRAKSEEGRMNHRTRTLWLPALITLLSASLSLMLCQFWGMKPQLVWVGNLGMTFYWPWLATLPLLGGLGTYLSFRAQGSAAVRLAAGLSPSLIMLIVMCLILPWGLAIDGLSFFRLVAFGLGLINWVVIPAAALLAGALPFLRTPLHHSAKSAA